jgi:GT2 family glycosyltransferase
VKEKMVSIIILNWNGKKFIKDCFESIKKNTLYKNFEVIFVDNGSTDGSEKTLKEWEKKKWIKLIQNPENKGFAYANNQGFKKAKGEYFFMLNNDTIVLKGWLKNAVELMESDERIAAVGSQLIDLKQFKKKSFKVLPERERLTVCGAAMLLRKSVCKKIGLLDYKNFSPIYGEETDWCYRARNAGFKIMETGKSLIVHVGSATTTKGKPNKKQYELLNTHRLKAMLFNLSFTDFLKHVPGLGLILLNSLREGMLKAVLKSY